MPRKLIALSVLLVVAAPLVSAQAISAAKTAAPATSIAPIKIGGDVLPPVLIHSVEPQYPRPLFHKPRPSITLVGLTVPVDGVPTDLHIVKSGGASFDKAALKAVKQYRFNPATLHGKPVPVAINVQNQFKVF